MAVQLYFIAFFGTICYKYYECTGMFWNSMVYYTEELQIIVKNLIQNFGHNIPELVYYH